MSRIGLVGGTPYHRDLMQQWLTGARCVRSVRPIDDDRRHNGHGNGRVNGHGNGRVNGNGRADGRQVDLVVGIIDDADDPALEDCRRLTDAGRAMPFVVVLLTPGPRVLQAALQAGAGGVVASVSGAARLTETITAVAGGAARLDPALSPIAMQQMVRPANGEEFGLSPMEQQVAACFSEGLTNREIGDRLGIGKETVKSHVSNIYRKLDVNDRPSAVTALQGRTPTLHQTPAPAPPDGGADDRGRR